MENIINDISDVADSCSSTVVKKKLQPTEEVELKNFETKVDEVLNILNMILNENKPEQEEGIRQADKFLGEDKKENIDDFLVKVRDQRTIINKIDDGKNTNGAMEKDKLTFMAEIEKDAAKRAADRKERELTAQNLRKLGNKAFREGEYEKAVGIYNKAIDLVRDSPILYNNRALCYIKLQLYKRSIIDCDFVLNKLDDRNLRSWMYRAKGYYLLGERRNYEKSITEAKKSNPKELATIEKMQLEIEKNEN